MRQTWPGFQEAAREPLETGDPAGGHGRQPRIEPLTRSLTSHVGELLGQLVGEGARRLLVTQPPELGPILLGQSGLRQTSKQATWRAVRTRATGERGGDAVDADGCSLRRYLLVPFHFAGALLQTANQQEPAPTGGTFAGPGQAFVRLPTTSVCWPVV